MLSSTSRSWLGRPAKMAVLIGLTLFGCSTTSLNDLVLTDHPQAPSLREYSPKGSPTKPKCDPPIEIISASELGRPHRELGTLTANCYPGARTVCEDRLRESACELHADAVILMEPQGGGSPPGASQRPQIAMSGRAVRWEK